MTKKNQQHNLEPYWYEHDAWSQDALVCGIDEAGRGPAAGPIVVAAAIIPQGSDKLFLKDSKCLSVQQRAQALKWIKMHAKYSVVVVDHRLVDQYNVYQATKRAMIKAYVQLLEIAQDALLQYVLVDAMPLILPKREGYSNPNVISFPRAESLSRSVAAASIIAKETRDAIMVNLDPLFPYYNFKQHKGYCTVEHQRLLRERGASLIHRKSFVRTILKNAIKHDTEQQSFF